MAVQLIIDAGCDLNLSQAQTLGVKLIPMTIRFDDEEFRSGVDITTEMFYERLKSAKDLPTTSQPTPYDFEQAYKEVIEAGDEAVVLCISSSLSGTYQSAIIAAADYTGSIHIVDTKAVSVGQKILLDYALSLRNHGATAKDIAEAIEKKKSDLCIFGVVDSLEYLIKGGRLSKAAGTVGSMLGIRPVLHLSNGALEVIGKARGPKAAVTMTHNFINEIGVNFSMPSGLGYTGNDATVLDPFLQVQNCQWDKAQAAIYNVGSTVGTHTGPGLFMVAFFRKS